MEFKVESCFNFSKNEKRVYDMLLVTMAEPIY